MRLPSPSASIWYDASLVTDTQVAALLRMKPVAGLPPQSWGWIVRPTPQDTYTSAMRKLNG